MICIFSSPANERRKGVREKKKKGEEVESGYELPSTRGGRPRNAMPASRKRLKREGGEGKERKKKREKKKGGEILVEA